MLKCAFLRRLSRSCALLSLSMLRKASKVSSLRVGGHSTQPVHPSSIFLRSSSRASSLPNSTLDLDPSYRQLLQDIDITLKKHSLDPVKPRRELEVLKKGSTSAIHEITSEEWVSMDSAPSELFVEENDDDGHRKSPATLFGSDQLGTVIIPLELQNAINLLIAGDYSLVGLSYSTTDTLQRERSLRYEVMPDGCSQRQRQTEAWKTIGTQITTKNIVPGRKRRVIRRETGQPLPRWLSPRIILQ